MKQSVLMLICASLASAGVALAGSLAKTQPERVGMSSGQLHRFGEKLQELVDNEVSAGFQVVVARRGEVVMHESYGVTNIDTGQPVTEDTLYRIFSMTKPIVSTAMMLLYEEGKYSLSDPIAKYIPAFDGLKVFAGLDEDGNVQLEDAVRPPTIHDLFRHTAGFTYGFFGDTPVDQMYVDAGLLMRARPADDMIAALAEIPLLHQPGSIYHYSVATDIEGYLIEVLSGMDIDSFIRSRILEPLDMDETIAWVPPDKADLLTSIHTHDEEGGLAVFVDAEDAKIRTDTVFEEPVYWSGGSQLISTADDYWRFAQMLANDGELDGVRILSPSTVRTMTSNRLPETVPDRSTAPGWGKGFNLYIVKDASLIEYPVSNKQFGKGGLATTHFWVDPELELVVVVMNQYLPWSNPQYVDIAHRMVLSAVIE